MELLGKASVHVNWGIIPPPFLSAVVPVRTGDLTGPAGRLQAAVRSSSTASSTSSVNGVTSMTLPSWVNGYPSWASAPQHGCTGLDRPLPRMVCGLRDARYFSALRKSATRSPIIMVVAFVLARIQSGMMEASAIRRFSSPCTRPCWSTTARGSEAGPILQVPQM